MKNRLSYAVLETIYRSSNLLNVELGKIFKEYNLTGTEFGIMEAIYSLGAQTIQEIAKRALLTSGGMTYTKKQMMTKNLIYEELCKEDKRISYLHLTDEGKELIVKVLEKHDIYLDKLLSKLTTEEKKQIARLLRKIYK